MNHSTHIGIGIDCGTSGIRAVAVNTDGILLAKSDLALNEQTPNQWWQKTICLLDRLFDDLHNNHLIQSSQIAISLDATSSSLFLINQYGLPISPVMMYFDACQPAANRIQNLLSANSGAQGAQSSLVKALTLSASLPNQSTNQDDWMVCHQADWLLFQLSGRLGVSDENNCLKLGYDPIHQEWEESTLRLLNKKHLPQVFAPATPIAHLKADLCHRWKLPKDTIICAGTTDSVAAFIGTGADQQGDAVVSLGSTLSFKLLTQKPYFDAEKGIYSHRLWQDWLVGGASNAGGACLLEEFDLALLKRLSAESSLLIENKLTGYYPLPQNRIGERFPINDPTKQAMSLPEHFSDSEKFSALLHGLVDIEQQAWQALSHSCQQPIQRLFACGGGNQNPAWSGLRKTLLNYPHTLPLSEEAAVGSARLAIKGLAIMSSKQSF